MLLLGAPLFTEEVEEHAHCFGLVAPSPFGSPIVSNPDLIAKLKAGAELAAPKQDLFYTPKCRRLHGLPRRIAGQGTPPEQSGGSLFFVPHP